MKKAIYFTLGSIFLTSSIVAASVILPTVTVSQNYSFYNFNFSSNIYSSSGDFVLRFSDDNLTSTNINYKKLILGSKEYNSGNYVLYIGSQGYSTNNTFLYGSQTMDSNRVSVANSQPILNGDFGSIFNEYNGNDSAYDKLITKPKILVIQDVLTIDDYNDRDEFVNMVLEYKNLINNDQENQFVDDSEKTENQKKQEWAQALYDNFTQEDYFGFSMEPGSTYLDWNGKECYYRKTNKFPLLFNSIVDFVKSNFNNLNSLNSSSGIVLGYKDGVFCEEFGGSFNISTDDGSTDSSDTTTQSSISQLNNFYSLFDVNLSSKSIDYNTNNSFITWILNCYA